MWLSWEETPDSFGVRLGSISCFICMEDIQCNTRIIPLLLFKGKKKCTFLLKGCWFRLYLWINTIKRCFYNPVTRLTWSVYVLLFIKGIQRTKSSQHKHAHLRVKSQLHRVPSRRSTRWRDLHHARQQQEVRVRPRRRRKKPQGNVIPLGFGCAGRPGLTGSHCGWWMGGRGEGCG